MEALDQFEDIEPKDAWRIENDDDAIWAMRKLSQAQAEVCRLEALAKHEIDRIVRWVEQATKSHKRTAAVFEEHLLDYGRRERDKRKTITLPYGKIKSRATEKVEIGENFVDWAAGERDDLIVYQQPKPNLNEIKRLLRAGDKIPHCVLGEGVSFSVEVSDEH